MDSPARTLALRTATLLVVANIIGTGIFTATGLLLGSVGSTWLVLVLWGLGGIVALAGALCYAELSSAIPQNGADATLLGRMYHPSLGFVAAVVSLVVGFAGPVASAGLALEEYLLPLLPPWIPPKSLGFLVIVALTVLHARDVSGAAQTQDALTLPKIGVLVVMGLLLVAYGSWSHVGATDPRGFGDALGQAGIGGAFILVAYAYSGWNGAAYVAGEVKDPIRNVPRALILGTLIVTGVYLLLNLGFLVAAPYGALAGRKDIGAAAAEAAFGPTGRVVVAVIIGLGYVSAIGAWIMAGPRVYAATAAPLPRLSWLARRNARGAPANAVWFQTVLTMLLFFGSGLAELLTFMGILLSLSSALTVLGLIVLRIREPDLERPYRVPLYPLTPIVAGGVLLWMVVLALAEDQMAALWCVVTVAVGIVLYLVVRRRPPSPSGPSTGTSPS